MIKNISSKTIFLNCLLFIYLFIYCTFASSFNSINFFSVFIPISFSGLFLVLNLKLLEDSKSKIIYTIMFIINLFILAINVKQRILPLTHMDFYSFDIFAKSAIENSNNIFGLLQKSIDLFVFLVALVYKFFGSHPEMIAFYVFPFTLLNFKYMYKTVLEIINKKNIALIAAFILNFWPVNYLFGFAVLREIPNQFFIVVSFYYIVKFIKSEKQTDIIKNSICAIAFALLSAAVHSGFVGIVCVYIYVILQKLIFKKVKIFNIPIIFSVLLIVFIISNTSLWPKIAGRFAFMNSVDDLLEYMKMRYVYLEANTTYIHSAPQTLLELILSIPYRMVMFVFAPFIWQVYDFPTFFAFLCDSVPRLLMIIGIIIILFKKNKTLENKAIINTAILVFLSTWFIFCLDVNNYGTAMRHRTKLLPIELAIFIGYGYIYYLNFMKAKIINKKIKHKKVNKVLHVLASNKFSGAENVVCTIIETLKDDYNMAYCSPMGPIEDVLNKRNIRYFGLKKMNLKSLKKIINVYQPDVIHAHDYRASILTAFSGFNGKIISHLHNNCPFAKSWNLKSYLYSITIKKYNIILGVSNKVYDEAIFKNKMKNKFQLMYNYINKNNILTKAEIPYDKKYDLFFIGRLTAQKQPYIFIKIVNEIKKTYPNISAVMIGEGELLSGCNDLIKKLNLENNIVMNGFTDNPFAIIKQCKIGIMPSAWEGFGLTVIESMILGKPVLNSGVGGLGEIFKNNPEFICKNDGVEKTIELLKDNNKYNKLSKQAKLISKKFTDEEAYKQAMKKIYN